MEHPYHHKLPELSEKPLSDLAYSHDRLDNFELEWQLYILTYVIGKLALVFGGFHHFWENENDKAFIIDGWRLGICDLTPRQIFNGLYVIICLRTEYSSRPPRSGMEFHKVCKDASLPYIPDPNILMLEQRESSEYEKLMARNKAIKELKKVFHTLKAPDTLCARAQYDVLPKNIRDNLNEWSK